MIAKRLILFFIMPLLCITLVYAKEIEIKGNQELILDRIVADPGDGSTIEAELRSVQRGYETKGDIRGMANYPSSETKSSKLPYSDADDYRIVAKSKAIVKGPFPGSGLRLFGEFFLDKALNFLGEGVWDGKKNGAKHTIIGTLKLYDYQFTSDERKPLIFLITPKGYVFQSGKGTVKDLNSGDNYILDK